MQFQEIKLGGGGLVFASTNSARVPFQFPTPVDGVYAVLQGARLERAGERGSYYTSGPDEELEQLQVSLLPLFDALQSRTQGQVQIDIRFPGVTTSLSADLIQAEIDVLVIGI